MKKMNSQYNALKAMTLTINDIISDLEKRRDVIDKKADDEYRGMNCMELAMHDELDEQINSLYVCVEYIKNAMGQLVLYID